MDKVEKEVYTNKELRDTLESYNLNDETIDLIEIKIYIKKWATYESNVDFEDLSYKGYKYDLLGFLAQKRNDPELYYTDDNGEYKEYDRIDLFLNEIDDKEINVIENYLEYDVHGESDSWYPINKLHGDLQAVNWINETPQEIKEEFESKYREKDYCEVNDFSDMSFNGDSPHFYEHSNNVNTIYFNINSKGANYDIRWINKKNVST